MSENFEELYNKLKQEFESSKKDNDEICKEYESTIEMLSESVENIKREKLVLEQKLSKLEQDQKKFDKEKESLMNKNKDKILDIQNLNKQNDKLTNEINKLKEEKALFDSKIVNLENDNEHLQNKMREYEALADDLENQLETALEENITLQTEFETYKQTVGDEIIRKDEELRDIKNDLLNKEKYIQKLKKNGYSVFVKNLQKSFKEGGNVQEKRRFTLLPGLFGQGGGNDSLLQFQKNLASNSVVNNNDVSSENGEKQNKNEMNNNNSNLSDKYKARNSLFSSGLGSLIKLVNKKEELIKGIKGSKDFGDGKIENKYLLSSNKSLLSGKLTDRKFDTNTQIDEISEFSEKEKEFKNLKICQENLFDYISIGKKSQNKTSLPQYSRILGNEQAIIDDLQDLLGRIRTRKDRLKKQKAANRERIARLKRS